jgi:hypothetical protein
MSEQARKQVLPQPPPLTNPGSISAPPGPMPRLKELDEVVLDSEIKVQDKSGKVEVTTHREQQAKKRKTK